MEKMKQRRSFFFVCSCKCQITGIGIKNIQRSVIRFVILVKYVNVTRSKHFPVTLESQYASSGRQTNSSVTVMPIPQQIINAAVARTIFRKRGTTKTR